MAAAQACAAMAPDRVDFIDEDDAGGVLLALLEKVANAAGADADEHFNEVRAGNREERNVGFAGNRAGQQGLAGSRRADEQHALGNASAELLEFLRILQEVDDFVKLFLGFVDSGDILEGGFLLLRGEQARAGLPEAQRLVPARLHLLHHENPEEDQKDERAEVEEQADPVGVLHFLVVVENVLVLKSLGDIGNGGVGDGHAAELAAVAVFALKLGAVGREIDRDVFDVPALHLGEKIGVAGLVLVSRGPARGGHLPQHDGQQNHQKPK